MVLNTLRCITFWCLTCCLLVGNALGQDIRRNRKQQLDTAEMRQFADELYQQGQYYGAIAYYQQLEEANGASYAQWYKMAEAYRQLRYYADAGDYYRKAADSPAQQYARALYWGGLSYKASGKYDEALRLLHQLIGMNPPELARQVTAARNLITSINQAKNIITKRGDVAIKKWVTPSIKSNSDFGAIEGDSATVYYSGVELLAGSRNQQYNGFRGRYDTLYVTRLYTTDLGASGRTPLGIDPNPETANVGSPSLSPNGQRLYYTHCPGIESTAECAIYYTERTSKGKWGKPQKLPGPVNASGANSRHPMVVNVGQGTQVLFFSTDRAGGNGGYDIWYSKMDSTGAFTEALNVGPIINTAGDEVTPYYDAASKNLFFSSNGHSGLGEFDVYMVLNNFAQGAGKIYNLGYPLNSSSDDYYFNINAGGRAGFLTSNRTSAGATGRETCCDQVFSLLFREPFTYKKLPNYFAEVAAFNAQDGAFNLFNESFAYRELPPDYYEAPLLAAQDVAIDGSLLDNGVAAAGRKVYLLDQDGNIVDSAYTDAQGKFAFRQLPGGQQYTVLLDESDRGMTASLTFTDGHGQLLATANSATDSQFFKYAQLNNYATSAGMLNAADVTISGALLDAGGGSAAGKTVLLVDANGNVVGRTTTDAQGRFAFRQLPGGQQYTVLLDETDRGMTATLAVSDGNGRVLGSTDNSNGQAFFKYTSLANYGTQAGPLSADDISISGTLLASGTAVAPNQKVLVVDETGRVVAAATSDANGRFNFRQLPGGHSYRILLDANNPGMSAQLQFRDSNGQLLAQANTDDDPQYFAYEQLATYQGGSTQITAEDVSINGSLLDANGKAAVNKRVVLIDGQGNMVGQTISDENGYFNFGALPAQGNYTVLFDEKDRGLKAALTFADPKGNNVVQVNSADDETYFQYGNLAAYTADARITDNTDTDIDPIKSEYVNQISPFMNVKDYRKLSDKLGQLPEGIVYRVQIGAYRYPKPGLFDNLQNDLGTIEREYIDGLTKFVVGRFSQLRSAEILRQTAEDLGVSDAFVSLYLDGKRIAILIY